MFLSQEGRNCLLTLLEMNDEPCMLLCFRYVLKLEYLFLFVTSFHHSILPNIKSILLTILFLHSVLLKLLHISSFYHRSKLYSESSCFTRLGQFSIPAVSAEILAALYTFFLFCCHSTVLLISVTQMVCCWCLCEVGIQHISPAKVANAGFLPTPRKRLHASCCSLSKVLGDTLCDRIGAP